MLFSWGMTHSVMYPVVSPPPWQEWCCFAIQITCNYTDIGYPLQWTMFDKRDPYYVDDDVFASVENTERNVQRLRDLDYRKPSPDQLFNFSGFYG